MEKPKKNKPHTLIINEIFHSIQGESTHAGRPCVFVRLTYCNLRCTYCDTEYAFTDGKEMSIDEIRREVKSFDCPLVEVTGGEPLFQENVHELMKFLCDDGYEVLLETGGSLGVEEVDSRVRKIIDFKCPTSGMEKKNLWENVEHLSGRDEVKFVIGNRSDYDWSKRMMAKYELPKRCVVLMSVTFGVLEPVALAGWILADRLPVRMQVQMHKIIWAPETKGV